MRSCCHTVKAKNCCEEGRRAIRVLRRRLQRFDQQSAEQLRECAWRCRALHVWYVSCRTRQTAAGWQQTQSGNWMRGYGWIGSALQGLVEWTCREVRPE